MLKKKLAFFLTAFAYAILLGHNLVAHHHHHKDLHSSKHHHTSHNHTDEEENNGLDNLFSHFIHPDNDITFTSQNINNNFSRSLLSIVAVLPVKLSLNVFLIPPLLYKPPAQHLFYISPHPVSPGLRAPPAFAA